MTTPAKMPFSLSKIHFQKGSLRGLSVLEVWGLLDLRFGGAHEGIGSGYRSISARIGSQGKCLRPSKARMKNDPGDIVRFEYFVRCPDD